MTFAELHGQITTILAEGLTPDAIADAICAAVGLEKPAPPESEPLPKDDPAVTEVPRDETQDSIDVATGTLTPEAVERRTQLKADQDAEAAAQVKADTADAVLHGAQEADDQAHAELAADQAEVAADEAAIAAEGAPVI